MDLIVEKQDGARVGPRGGDGAGGSLQLYLFKELFTDDILEPRYKVSKGPCGP